MRAVMAGDTPTLMSLWTDDIVSLPPVRPIRSGRAANAAALRETMQQMKGSEPLDYRLESIQTDRLPNLDPVIVRRAPSIQFGDSVISSLSLTYERDFATLVELGDHEPMLAGLRRRRIIVDSPRMTAREERKK